jgi:hypothetical protein
VELIFRDHEIWMKGKIKTELDRFVFDFVKILDVRYVVVSGYVVILFGRSRGTEDIDVLTERFEPAKFEEIFDKLVKNGYYFLNSDDPEKLYEMLDDGLAVRIAKINTVIPNIELKFVRSEIDRFSLENRLKVVIDDESIYIPPPEVQIPYKLYLGSVRDIEDAVYLWEIFKDYINIYTLHHYMKKLGVEGEQYGIG